MIRTNGWKQGIIGVIAATVVVLGIFAFAAINPEAADVRAVEAEHKSLKTEHAAVQEELAAVKAELAEVEKHLAELRQPGDADVSDTESGDVAADIKDGTVEVKLREMAFHPEEIRIRPGTVVRFVNDEDIEHDIVQATPDQVTDLGDRHHHNDDGHGPMDVEYGFHSPHLHHTGDTWEARFTEPGEYPILCTVGGHYQMGMVGKIIVEEE